MWKPPVHAVLLRHIIINLLRVQKSLVANTTFWLQILYAALFALPDAEQIVHGIQAQIIFEFQKTKTIVFEQYFDNKSEFYDK